MQKTPCPLHQNLSLVGKPSKRRTSDPDHSFSRRLIHSSSLESDQLRSKIPYKRKYKFKYLIYSVLLLLNFCLFIIAPSSHATSKPSDAKGKNIIKEEKTCPKGQYLNPDTKRCKKFPPQKFKTCKPGYFLNMKTNRCNKIPRSRPKTGSTSPSSPTIQNPQQPKTPNNQTSTKENKKPCKSGYFLNKITGRCNKEHTQTPKTCPAGFFLNKVTNHCNKNQVEPEKKPCKADQYRNPKTGRCHKIAAPTTPKTCPAGKTLNPVTNRCKGEAKSNEIKPCKEGYERNETTHRCRKIHQNTGATNPVEVPKLGDNKENQKKDFNGTAAVAGSAAVGFGIAIFQFKNEIFVIIRKIFFHK